MKKVFHSFPCFCSRLIVSLHHETSVFHNFPPSLPAPGGAGADASLGWQLRFEPLLDRLYKVSQIIPQEKVYIHMDNTCYFQGIFP